MPFSKSTKPAHLPLFLGPWFKPHSLCASSLLSGTWQKRLSLSKKGCSMVHRPVHTRTLLHPAHTLRRPIPHNRGGWAQPLIPTKVHYLRAKTPSQHQLGFACLHIGAAEGMQGQPIMGKMKMFLRGLAVAMVPSAASFPKALFCYWLTANVFSMAQTTLLKKPYLKKALDIPDTSDLDPSNVAGPVVTFSQPPKQSQVAGPAVTFSQPPKQSQVAGPAVTFSQPPKQAKSRKAASRKP